MANIVLAPEIPRTIGLAPNYTAIATGNTYKVRNNGRTMLHFLKSGAGEAIITFQTPGSIGGLAIAERTLSVPASSGDKMVGGFPTDIYNDANGDLNFTTDEGTGLTAAVVDI